MHYRWDRYQHFWTAILTCQGGKPLKQHLVHGTLHYRAPKGSCCEFLNWKRTELLLRSLKICFCSPTDPQEQLACWSNTAISHCQFRGTLCRYYREERWCDTLHLFLITPLKKRAKLNSIHPLAVSTAALPGWAGWSCGYGYCSDHGCICG